MYKKPLFTDKGFAKCIRPLSKKSMKISENSVKESTKVFVMLCQALWKSLNSDSEMYDVNTLIGTVVLRIILPVQFRSIQYRSCEVDKV